MDVDHLLHSSSATLESAASPGAGRVGHLAPMVLELAVRVLLDLIRVRVSRRGGRRGAGGGPSGPGVAGGARGRIDERLAPGGLRTGPTSVGPRARSLSRGKPPLALGPYPWHEAKKMFSGSVVSSQGRQTWNVWCPSLTGVLKLYFWDWGTTEPTQAWVPLPVKWREVRRAAPGQDKGGALAVVHVKVQDGHALDALVAVDVEGVGGADRHVVEEAKAVRAVGVLLARHHPHGPGVVPGRPDGAEGVAGLSLHHVVDGVRDGPGRHQRGKVGLPADRRVAVQVPGRRGVLREGGADLVLGGGLG